MPGLCGVAKTNSVSMVPDISITRDKQDNIMNDILVFSLTDCIQKFLNVFTNWKRNTICLPFINKLDALLIFLFSVRRSHKPVVKKLPFCREMIETAEEKVSVLSLEDVKQTAKRK